VKRKPINSELVSLAAKTITVKGKLVSRDGFNMIENAEIEEIAEAAAESTRDA
jgi:hypothetical protein